MEGRQGIEGGGRAPSSAIRGLRRRVEGVCVHIEAVRARDKPVRSLLGHAQDPASTSRPVADGCSAQRAAAAASASIAPAGRRAAWRAAAAALESTTGRPSGSESASESSGRLRAGATALGPGVSAPVEKRGGKERGGGGCRPSMAAAAHRGQEEGDERNLG
jgi:hypothetical protein